MTQTESTQIEDNNGAAAEVIGEGGAVELAVASADFSIDEGDGMVNLSLLLSPRKARRLAVLLLQAAEAQEGDDE
jgi:hypothetical protein